MKFALHILNCLEESARSKFFFFGGYQGHRTGVGVTTVSNSLILGGWATKVYRIPKKIGGWKGGWQQYFDVSFITGLTKNAT